MLTRLNLSSKIIERIPVFIIGGFLGSGKTSCVPIRIEELNLNRHVVGNLIFR